MWLEKAKPGGVHALLELKMQDANLITWGGAADGEYELAFADGEISLSGQLVDREGDVIMSFAGDELGLHGGVRIEVAPVVDAPIRDWSVGGGLRRE